MDERIIVTQEETPYDFGHGVVLSMDPKRARVLFHDLNRLLSLICDAGCLDDALDCESYERVSGLVQSLQPVVEEVEEEEQR